MATTSAHKGFDPEAEQEVDFARYGRMLARRWWLVAVGVVAGAVIGFLVSLGGTKVYSATATIYLGQPYNGTTAINTYQTNPSAVAQIVNAQSVDETVAKQCSGKSDKSGKSGKSGKVTAESFRKGISVQKIASSTPTKGTGAQINPLVTVTVQTAKGKVAACAANALAQAAVVGISGYPRKKIKNLSSHVASDINAIKSINAAIADPNVSGTDKAVLQQSLRADQTDLLVAQQSLLVAQTVEMPKVTIRAGAHQVTAQSSHNTVVIAALIGLILGVIGALMWDRIVPRLSASNGS